MSGKHDRALVLLNYYRLLWVWSFSNHFGGADIRDTVDLSAYAYLTGSRGSDIKFGVSLICFVVWRIFAYTHASLFSTHYFSWQVDLIWKEGQMHTLSIHLHIPSQYTSFIVNFWCLVLIPQVTVVNSQFIYCVYIFGWNLQRCLWR